jgi:hypothetical protein
MVLFGLGVLGEYVGRIYQQVRARPRYTIRAVLEQPQTEVIEPRLVDATENATEIATEIATENSTEQSTERTAD